MNWRQAYRQWTNGRYTRVSTDAAFQAGWEAAMQEMGSQPLPMAQDEHLPSWGVGKTSIVEQAAEEAKAEVITSHPAVSDPTDYKGLPWSTESQDEHLPTLEGVIDYLERQNEQAFLAYRRLERGSEPGMNKDVRIRLMEYAYEQWQATGEALYKAKEAAKNPGPGVTYIDTINGMLDRHFIKRV